MLGALIADIAATTFERCQKEFYSHLIIEKSSPSAYGHALLSSASYLLFLQSDRNLEIQEGRAGNSLEFKGKWLLWHIACIWLCENPERRSHQFMNLDQEDTAAAVFVTDLIVALCQGATKSEAFHQCKGFEEKIKQSGFKNPRIEASLLIYVYRAWDCFYRGFDFTSSIHNAMRWSGDKHLLACLTGAFAEAMYGCTYCFIKRKYAKDSNDLRTDLNIYPIVKRMGYSDNLIRLIREKIARKRCFYAKNDAQTSVERHQWTDVCCPSIRFSQEDKKRILLSAPTSWENRYGFYLDDGWIYSYRSGIILGRFKLQENDNHWTMTYTQISEERKNLDFWVGICSALYEGCHISNKHIYAYTCKLELCKFFHGEIVIPQKIKGGRNEMLWYEEKQFAIRED